MGGTVVELPWPPPEPLPPPPPLVASTDGIFLRKSKFTVGTGIGPQLQLSFGLCDFRLWGDPRKPLGFSKL